MVLIPISPHSEHLTRKILDLLRAAERELRSRSLFCRISVREEVSE